MHALVAGLQACHSVAPTSRGTFLLLAHQCWPTTFLLAHHLHQLGLSRPQHHWQLGGTLVTRERDIQQQGTQMRL